MTRHSRTPRAYLTRYGRGLPQADLARIHNGGPKGHKKPATLGYLRKFLRALVNPAR